MGKKNFVKNTGSARVGQREKPKIRKIDKDANRKNNRDFRKNMALGLPHKKFDKNLKIPKLNMFKDKIVD